MTVRVTPLISGKTVELSKSTGIYEKQVLPYGKFGYKGDSFEITPEWVDNAISAFNDKVYDVVNFALADENNSHNVDERPDRYAGKVLSLKKTPEGLNAVFKLTNKAATLVDDTDGELGVSVRFRELYTRESDGRSWPVVIDQVLGTLDPKITGMAPWKAITLSNVKDSNDLKDSSSEEWEMTKPVDDNANNDNNDENKVTLTKDEYTKFKELLAKETVDTTDDSDLDALVDELEDKTGTKFDKKARQTVGLSNEAKRVVELSHQVALGRFERDALAWKQAGVPPRIIELAQSVLASYEPVRTVSLSNGTETVTDAREVVKAILEECKGIVNLSQEAGHSTRGNQQDKEFDALYKSVLDQATQF